MKGGSDVFEICKECGKRIYDKESAQNAVNYATKKHWKNSPRKIPIRIYQYPFCNHYHLTKEEKDGRKTNKVQKQERYSDERRRVRRLETDLHRYAREHRQSL